METIISKPVGVGKFFNIGDKASIRLSPKGRIVFSVKDEIDNNEASASLSVGELQELMAAAQDVLKVKS